MSQTRGNAADITVLGEDRSTRSSNGQSVFGEQKHANPRTAKY
jgi:hypothetical protein